MSRATLSLGGRAPAWRKNFRRGQKVDPRKVNRLMAQAYPELFGDPESPKPLAVGIRVKLQADPDLPVSKVQLRRFLWWWTRQPAYQSARDRGLERVDLQK